MHIQPFNLDELHFAWCNRIYFRTRTHRRKRISCLANFKIQSLQDILQSYGIHALEVATTEQELQCLLSLQPTETTASAISKTKGRISKWLTEQIELPAEKGKHLATGYFAVTVGQSNASAIDDYLEKQAEHHGYVERARPPVFVQKYSLTEDARAKLNAAHAVALLRYHLVFATPYRKGVFTDESAKQVAERWLEIQSQFYIDKVSFVPDHVHVAICVHPSASPAQIVCQLFNTAQQFMWDRFDYLVCKAGVDRLWQASAYIGSYGNLTSNAISAYMKRWMDDT